MHSLCNIPRQADQISSLQTLFQNLLPLVEIHLRQKVNHLPCPHAREDLIAEVLACIWEVLLHLNASGLLTGMDARALASLGMRLVRESQKRECDILNPHTGKRWGFRVEQLH